MWQGLPTGDMFVFHKLFLFVFFFFVVLKTGHNQQGCLYVGNRFGKDPGTSVWQISRTIFFLMYINPLVNKLIWKEALTSFHNIKSNLASIHHWWDLGTSPLTHWPWWMNVFWHVTRMIWLGAMFYKHHMPITFRWKKIMSRYCYLKKSLKIWFSTVCCICRGPLL